MTNINDTRTEVFNQLIEVGKCIDALKDVYDGIPDNERYSSVFSILGDRLNLEFKALESLVYRVSSNN